MILKKEPELHVYSCGQCGALVETEDGLLAHTETCMPNIMEEGEVHKESHGSEDQVTVNEDSEESQPTKKIRSVSCTACGASFPNKVGDFYFFSSIVSMMNLIL